MFPGVHLLSPKFSISVYNLGLYIDLIQSNLHIRRGRGAGLLQIFLSSPLLTLKTTFAGLLSVRIQLERNTHLLNQQRFYESEFHLWPLGMTQAEIRVGRGCGKEVGQGLVSKVPPCH